MKQGIEIIANLGRCAHTQAQEAQWQVVFELIRSTPDLVYQTDPHPKTFGWTFTDHAAYQCRMDVLLNLRQQFNHFQQPQTAVILYHAQQQNWPWVLDLLKERILSANVVHTLPSGNRATLIDLAKHCGLNETAKLLRDQYAGKTAQEVEEISARQQMFKAAKLQDWLTVFRLLNNAITHVDDVDRWVTKDWVLVQYAFEQRNQTVFLKLIADYGASLDEIRNDDKFLHDCLIQFHDQCVNTLQTLAEEQLVEKFKQILGKFKDDDEIENAPVVDLCLQMTLLLRACSARIFDQIPRSDQVGIHLLNPQNDEVIPRKVEKRVPWG